MSLFADLAGQVLGAVGSGHGSPQAAVLKTVLGMLGGGQGGGLQGLLGGFQQHGLGDVLSSWISTGQNLPVSGGQLTKVFGADQIGQMASQLGMSTDVFSGHLAEVLPHVVDKLSPQGELPAADILQQGLGGLLGKLF